MLILLILLALLFPRPVSALYDPLSVANNRFGIHIVDTNDLPDVPKLINSTGGDWGYVTMVLSDNERDPGRWQFIFDHMRRVHLIPIIRLATHVEKGVWVKPNKDRFYEIVNLLNKLNWPTENRYVTLYNEPNHAKEWENTLDPEDYAETLVTLAQELKKANEDFFILPAGLDASAASDGLSMDAAEYLRRMIAARPEILTLIDGWTSHSYPNPAFSGSPYATGRGTLRTFEWELLYLRTLGLTKNLPVFITETGWMHSAGKIYLPGLLSPDQVGANLQIAASSVWSDSRIAAITPFIYNYQDVPFDHFSWKTLGNQTFYPMYYSYQSLPKQKGEPRQRLVYTLISELLPKKLIAGSTYTLSTEIQNNGQGILNDGSYVLKIVSPNRVIEASSEPLPVLEPTQKGTITIHIKTPDEGTTLPVFVSLAHNNQEIPLEERTIELVPPPKVEIRGRLGWRKTSAATNVTVLVYDKNTLLQKIPGLGMKNGVVVAQGLRDIVPGNPYRVVILVPGYLPRQVIGAVTGTSTTIYPKRFLPLDFNGDGTFSLADVKTLLPLSPLSALARFFGP